MTRTESRQEALRSRIEPKFTAEQVAFASSPATLKMQIGMSLAQRCAAFEKKYAGKKMTVYYLRKIYREAGIRRKKIKKTKIVDEQQRARMKQQAIEAHDRVQSLSGLGYRIIYLDEVMVTKSTIPTHEYSPFKQPVVVDLKGFSLGHFRKENRSFIQARRPPRPRGRIVC